MTALSRALDPVLLAEDAGIFPDAWQADLLRTSSNRILINACRQSGKSTVCGILAAHRAVYHPKSLILLLSPSQRQSGELFQKCRAVLPVRPERESTLSLELVNGSRVVSLPGKEATVRGYSGVDLLIIDESARVLDEMYMSVRPMLAVSGGRLVALSTPWGKRGWWYDAWQGEEPWERYRITAQECPRISPRFLEEERRSLGERWFCQEYMCSFEETEDSVFGFDVVQAAVTDAVLPLFGGE